MRVLNWNIEWMNDWFVGNGLVQWRNSHTGIQNVAALADRVAALIRGVDPDLVTIQEGPSDIREMELFVNDHLRDGAGQPLYRIFGGIDGGAQKIYALVKENGGLENAVLADDQVTLDLTDEWPSDVNGDAVLEPYDFTRDPLVLDARITDTGRLYEVGGWFRYGIRDGQLRHWPVEVETEAEPVLARPVLHSHTTWLSDETLRVVADFPRDFFADRVACDTDPDGTGDTTRVWLWVR